MESSESNVSKSVEAIEGSKKEIDKKVAKILKLINSKDRDRKGKAKIPKDTRKESELTGLIEEFHKDYQSLYSRLVRRESRKKSQSKKGKESLSSSNSSSDSTSKYYSSEDIDIVTGESENEHHKATISLKEELGTAKLEVAELKHKLASTTEEKEALNSEYLATLNKLQEAEAIYKNLRGEMDKRERELSAYGSETSVQIKELEGQMSTLKAELEHLHSQNRDMEAQVESKATEANQLAEKNTELQARIVELELISKEKGKEISDCLKKLRDNDDNLTSRIKNLMSQVSSLQGELDNLHAQKDEASNEGLGLMDEVNVMQQELSFLRNRKTDLESQLERKTKEVSENLIQIEKMKNGLTRETAVQRGMPEEKGDNLLVQGNDLELEVTYLRKQNIELKQLIEDNRHETDQLRDEKGKLQAKISELEGTLAMRSDELSSIQKKYEDKQNEASNRIMASTARVNSLKEELNSLLTQKQQLEKQNKKLKQDCPQSQARVEKDPAKRLSGDKLAKQQSLDSKLNLHVTEKKMEELAETFHMKMENHIRLLHRRIVVAEQIQNENKDHYKIVKDKLELENRELAKRVAIYENQFRKAKGALEPGTNIFTELNLVVSKIDESNGNFLNRLSKISNEIHLAKNWISTKKNELEGLKKNVDCLAAQLDDKGHQELLLKQKIQKLEAVLSTDGGNEMNSTATVSELAMKVGELEKKIKEKDESLLVLGEEKREAIRQLCVLIDFHRERHDRFKKIISKTTARGKITT